MPAVFMIRARLMPRSNRQAWPLSGRMTRRPRGSNRARRAPAQRQHPAHWRGSGWPWWCRFAACHQAPGVCLCRV
jgi:hypothetical protein